MTLAVTLALLSVGRVCAEKVTYEDHVFPIFEQACLNCHNPDKAKGGLDLSSYLGTMKGSSGGKIVEPGDGASSTIFNVVTHSSEPRMPPEGDKLEKKQADVIRAWIDGGLLETKSSSAKKREGPKIDFTVQAPTGKPDGPPPMPEDLLLDPVVVGERSAAVADMAASPWAPLLAVTGQKQVLLYHTGTLRLAGILPFPAGQPQSVSFHPGGKYLTAGGGIGGKSGTTVTWDITNGEVIMRNGRAYDSILAASLRSDLATVATGGPSRLIKIWDTRSGEQIRSVKKHTDWVTALSYSPDGILLATADRNGGVWVWEAESGNEFHTLRAHQNGITALAWRADSNFLASASEDGQVIFWEMNHGKQAKKITAHKEGVLAFDYARDGHFATAGRDKRVKIWKPDFNLKKELPPFENLIVEVAFSHDGKRLFTADWHGAIEVWDTKNFARAGTIDANPPTIATRLARLEEALEKAPETLAAAKGRLAKARRPVDEARKNLTTLTRRRDEEKKRLSQLDTGEKQAAQALVELDQERKHLAADRSQKKRDLDQARADLRGHEQSLKQTRRDLGKAQDREKALEQQEERLAAQGEKNADPLKKLRGQLAQARKDLAGLQSRLGELENDHPGVASRVGQLEAEWTALENERKEADQAWEELRDRRKALAESRKNLRNQLPRTEKDITKAQELVKTREEEIHPAEQEFESTKAKLARLASEQKFWQAAEVNARFLWLQSQLRETRLDHEAQLATFRETCRELEKLQAGLPGVTGKERTRLQAEVNTLSNEIARTKSLIDRQASQMIEWEARTTALRKHYEQLSAGL